MYKQTDRWRCVCILYTINFGSRKYWRVWWRHTTKVSPTNNFYPKLICYAKQPIHQYYFCKMFFGKVNPLKFPISKILCYTVEYRHIFRHRQTDVRMHWAGLWWCDIWDVSAGGAIDRRFHICYYVSICRDSALVLIIYVKCVLISTAHTQTHVHRHRDTHSHTQINTHHHR